MTAELLPDLSTGIQPSDAERFMRVAKGSGLRLSELTRPYDDSDLAVFQDSRYIETTRRTFGTYRRLGAEAIIHTIGYKLFDEPTQRGIPVAGFTMVRKSIIIPETEVVHGVVAVNPAEPLGIQALYKLLNTPPEKLAHFDPTRRHDA